MVPLLSGLRSLDCVSCQQGKHTRSSFASRVKTRVDAPFSLIHSDIWGPTRTVSILGFRYFVTFIDDYSRCTWIYLMQNRSELFSIYKKFSAEIHTQFGTSIRILRSDNAKEYVSFDFSNFLATQGTLHQTTCPHTPQQNGVAERKNRHLIETARTLLIHMNVPLHFWADAVFASCFLINRMPSSVINNDIPHNLLFPDAPLYPLSPHVFGSTCFVHDLTPGKDKLTSKAFKCIFVGYSRLQKGYRCYSPDLKRYIVSADVTFLDQQPFHSIPSQLSQVDQVLPVPFLDLSLLAAGDSIPEKRPLDSIPVDRPFLTYQRRQTVPPTDLTLADSPPSPVNSSPPAPSPEALPIAHRKVNMTGKQRDFGGTDSGDDQAALLNPGKKALNQIVQDDSFREFDFRQYLFACQSKLLFKLTRPFEVASRGHAFIISFSKALAHHENKLPFCTREVWVITASLALITATASQYKDGQVAPDIEKEFYRVQGDLYSLCRTKFMRLAYLIGYGLHIERSPVNSASLSMLPWPKPGVWPSLPPDASSEVLVKEKMMFEESLRVKHFGIQRKPLPLEPSVLLREANRRRASISAGNVFEMFDGHPNAIDGSGSMSSPAKAQSIPMSRTNSSPGNFESSISRPLRLSEICVAAEHALRSTISDAELWKSLSSVQEFEQKYLELSKGAANNYHRSWWKRHGVVLDGEIAAVFYKNGNYDLAAKLYEKVCALYAGEGWQNLLAEVLPNLAECQKELGDQAGYLSSCVRLLSLDKGLFSSKERQAFQSEVVRLAHSEMENTVPLYVSSLITFSGNPGPPLQLCDGDPGILSVIVWSGFPDDITLESLSLTLTATTNTDEGVEAIKRSGATILKPGRNTIMINLPPQRPGSYVLGVLTGKIGLLSFRSHSFSKGAPADSDDFMSYEKPTRPILKVFKPRSLVDLTAAVSSALLMNEPQWVGIIVKPISYSLKGAILHIDTGPGLSIEKSHNIEIERHVNGHTDELDHSEGSKDDDTSAATPEVKQMSLHDGNLELPDWASNITSVLWIPVRATSDELPKGAPAGAVVPQRQNLVEGLRTIALKLEFGVSRNQIFERTIAVHFTDPFSVSTRVTDKSTDGKLLLQVILQSQVQATLTIYDSWLDLQEGFAHTRSDDKKPISGFFPLVISPKSRAGILFSVCLASAPIKEEAEIQCPESILNIRFGILGNRAAGAHDPNAEEPSGHDGSTESLIFKSSLLLQRPVLDPCFAVGFLPLSSTDLQVGQLVSMRWRVERLKSLEENAASENNDDVLYEVHANSDHWMIAGRKRGHVLLSTKQGSRITVSVLCLPLVAGYVRPPQLGLPNVDKANICCNPPSPHLVCVFPPALSSSFCIPA